MLRIWLLTLPAFSITLFASAQTQPPAAAPAARATDAAAPHQEFRAKNVLGSKVSITGNVNIGTVDDIVFGEDGMVEYILVLNDGKYSTIPWSAAKFNYEQRTAVINITQDKYQVIPTFTTEKYPVFFEPTYRTEIYRYYNLTPREIRRIERRR